MNVEKISVNELRYLMIHDKNIFIIDIRKKEEYEIEHIAGAININSDDMMIKSCVDMKTFLDKNNINLTDKDIVVYCDRGGRSIYFTKYLVECGYNAVSLSGGYLAYSRR